jgi:membrane fusion protein, heavy metal efflux system
VVLPAIEVHADAHEAAHSEVAAMPEGIHFLKEQQWKIRLGTELVTRRRLVERLVFPARASAKPGAEVLVVAPLAGQLIEPAEGKPFPVLGQRVEAGQVLARLAPRFSEAATRLAEIEAEQVQARTELDQAQIAFDRVQRLFAEQAKSQRELQEAEAALLTARSRLDAAMALRSTYRQSEVASTTGSTVLPAVDLRAPISGIINRIDAGVGTVVGADSTILQVIDPAVVWLEARIPEGSIPRLRAAADPVYERLDDLGQYRGIEDSSGMFLGLEVDAATRTVPLTVEVRNPEHSLRVGQSVRLHLATARAEEALALPEAAIVEEAGRPVVFVQLSGEMFERREVILGIRDGGWVQLIEGVGEGERVVTDGAYVLRLASLASTLPTHGHAH